MDKKIADQLTELSQKMMDTVTTLQKINDRTVQDLAKQQLEAAESFIKSGSDQMKSMGNIKTVQDAVTNQAELASEVGKMILSNAQKSMEVLTRGQSELKNLIDQNIKELMEKAKGGGR
ncbi:MAG: Phasin 2 protein [Magnetococcales bacterium]|nr:Phasin 2 protein [Magnetococcales bacterium]HIJ84893.1 phasin family protein [Magnetococcales bacterium]